MKVIISEIVDTVQERCQCGFVHDRITSGVFRCCKAGVVDYRADIHGTANATSSELISVIEQWVDEGAAYRINRILLSVDKTCAVTIPSITFTEDCSCVPSTYSTPGQPTHAYGPTSKTDHNTIIVVGVTILAVIITFLFVVIIAVIVLLLKKHYCAKFKIEQLNIR